MTFVEPDSSPIEGLIFSAFGSSNLIHLRCNEQNSIWYDGH